MVIEILRAQQSTKRALGPYLGNMNLTFHEVCVLVAIGEGPSRTQCQLVEEVGFDKVTVSRACETLGKRKLLRRFPNEADHRSHFLELTPEGHDLRARSLEAWRGFLIDLQNEFTPLELEIFSGMLSRVLQNCLKITGRKLPRKKMQLVVV